MKGRKTKDYELSRRGMVKIKKMKKIGRLLNR